VDQPAGARRGVVATRRIVVCSRCANRTSDFAASYRENRFAGIIANGAIGAGIDVPQARGYSDWRHAFSVFAINIAMVIGPTPPGTGVIALAFFDTSSNATSPTRR